MLRPATPLAVMLFAAFVLLMLAVLSTPIIKAIPLGSFQGVNFGVFGLCTQTACSGIEIGYNGPVALATLFTPSDQASFDLPTSTRTTLSAILIVHPVAALLTLVMLIMSIAAHFHSPAHSVKYLLFLFIVSIFAFLTTLLSFLIDVLLFVPHMAWGSYLVLAATILHAMSGLVSCAMRRTLVSRKSRKKQIEQHAEMSGENFYNRQAQAATSLQTRQQPTVPIVTGSIGETDKLPTFATFDKKDDRSSDERVPLTSRSPSDRSPIPPSTGLSNQSDMVMAGAVVPPGQRRSMSINRDQYGNPINNSNPEFDAYGVRRGPSLERMNQNPRGRGGMPPGGYRGRGGYGPPGRGGYGTPPPGAGGRGGYGNRGPPGRGGYGPPPRGYGGSGRGRTPPPPGYQYERSGPYGGSPGPQDPRYNNANNMNPSMPSVSTDSYGAYNPSPQESELPRAESPPPLPGMDVNARALPAAEMEAPLVSPQQGKFGPNIRDSDSDIMGMVNLQQGNLGQGQPPRETFMSDGSRYSQDESQYVPPRAAWNQNGRNSPRMPSPLNVQSRSPIAELPSSSGGPANSRSPPPDRMRASPANGYLEDVDPRFATQRPTPPPIQTEQQQHPYDEIPQGARSPAESERSNFTSISQRGVNPRWNPPPSQLMPGYGGPQMRRGPPQRGPERNDILLNGNPDFQMPGQRSGSGGGGAGRMVPGSAYPAI